MTDSVEQETYNIQKSETIQNSYGMCYLDFNTEKTLKIQKENLTIPTSKHTTLPLTHSSQCRYIVDTFNVIMAPQNAKDSPREVNCKYKVKRE